MKKNVQCKRFTVSGQVQGVGFRPFVFRLAERHGLGGSVRNTPDGVLIEAWAEAPALERFQQALLTELPPLAKISACLIEEVEHDNPAPRSFVIHHTEPGLAHAVLISPDMATCADCLRDILDPRNRRHNYAFTNCTSCGPRYSIIADMPYDRAQTSMRCFGMCPDCAREYADPRDRRFHAQPNACPVCGPQIWFLESASENFHTDEAVANADLPENVQIRGEEALQALARSLASGKIAAVKGLGGFHLVCDAASTKAIQTLRERKNRPHKPLALMTADLETAGQIAELGPAEKRLLLSAERPIVLCPKGSRPAGVAPNIAPDAGYLGVMLPYTPLHHLLLRAFAAEKKRRAPDSADIPAALVMTSGNRGGEPIALGNREALQRLRDLADCFLLHNRDILIRTDDSVVRPNPAEDAFPMFLRRARGYVPRPLALPPLSTADSGRTVLALGAELKNTICLTRGPQAFVSQHIGDLQNPETIQFQMEIAGHLCRALQVKPNLLVTDAHPDFAGHAAGHTAGLTRALCVPPVTAAPPLKLQHHFAHAEAVLAENGQLAPALCLTLDGTGYAPGGEIWGGELLLINPTANQTSHPEENRKHDREHQRLGSLSLFPLPGGEAAIRQPWRITHGMLHRLGLQADVGFLPWLTEFAPTAKFIPQMLEKGLNTPLTGSCGRLFDAVSALLGLCLETTYEGQAAIRLEAAQGDPGEDFYAEFRAGGEPVLPCPVLRPQQAEPALLLDTATLFRSIFLARQEGASVRQLARAFHWHLAEGLAELALQGSRMIGKKTDLTVKRVGLSGGVMQNLSLFTLLAEKLHQRGLTPLMHRELPPNDGCIAYGQAAWAFRRNRG